MEALYEILSCLLPFSVEEFNFSADYLCPQLSLSKNNF